MDRKTIGIGFLSLSALILFIAQLIPVRTAIAAEAVNEHGYQVVTSRLVQGGEGLYIAESRSGLMAVYTWDPNSRRVVLRSVRPVGEAFEQ